ncbi:hypothetical protein HK096_005996, partial [Nowakowskiella sp. JEL0078]
MLQSPTTTFVDDLGDLNSSTDWDDDNGDEFLDSLLNSSSDAQLYSSPTASLSNLEEEKFDAKRVFFLLLAVFPEAVADPMLFPLFPYMVRHFFSDPSIDPSKIEVVTNLLWGRLSDTFGRRIILLINLCFTFTSLLAIAFADSFWIVVAARIVAGMFGANSTVVKGALGEIHKNSENRGAGYAWYSGMYGVAGISGPLVGGALMQLSTYITGINMTEFDTSDILIETTTSSWFKEALKRWPYLLPCFFAMSVHLIGFASALFWIKEPGRSSLSQSIVDMIKSVSKNCTNLLVYISPSQNFSYNAIYQSLSREEEFVEMSDSHENIQVSHKTIHRSNWGPAFSTRSIYSIGLYCLIAALQMTYTTSLPLYFSAPRPKLKPQELTLNKRNGMSGLGLTPSECSYIIMIASFSKLLSQVPVHRAIHSGIGVRKTYM